MRHIYRTAALLMAGSVLSASSASAQNSIETFANGNPDGWEIWFDVYNYLRPTGGNPGEYLELDDVTSGPSTCQFLDIKPDRMGGAVTLSHAGNWRAAGIDQVSIDVNIQTGPVGGILTVLLVSDPGTPGVPSDDCILRLSQTVAGPVQPGWTTLTFPVPTAQTTIPTGWSVDSTSTGCIAASLNQQWDSVVQDVDEVRFRYDTTPGFCAFTRWIFGIDNVTIGMPGPGAPGTNYCAANANSTGVPAVMSASGSNSVMANDLVLECSDMPLNSFSFFLTSTQQGFIANPAGSQGNLCLAGAIGRYVGPGQIQNSGGMGAISLAVNLSQHPQPAGFVQVAAGETWNFTAWYRDLVGGVPTSNFADGYSVLFQ